jgi:hypothetical protein
LDWAFDPDECLNFKILYPDLVPTMSVPPHTISSSEDVMDLTESFDKLLQKGDKDEIFAWAMDRLAWRWENTEAQGIAAFAFYVAGNHWMAREVAEEVLREDPTQEWALAVVFAGATLKEVQKRKEFVGEDGFHLGMEWIARFSAFDDEAESKKVLYCMARYGSGEQRAQLSEDWLAKLSWCGRSEKETNKRVTRRRKMPPRDEATP